MFGKNEVASKRVLDFAVHHVWYSIQGEGPWMGKPAIFVRLAGCNLRCFWCDTDFSEKRIASAHGLAMEIKLLCAMHRCNNVVITGGEPLLQPLPDLLLHFDATLIRFQVETAGTVWPEGMGRYVTRNPEGQVGMVLLVVSPKTPGIHASVGHYAGAWKYIVTDADLKAMRDEGGDGLPTLSTQRPDMPAHICRPMNDAPVFVQPLDVAGPASEAGFRNLCAARDIALAKGYRLSLQMHKIVGAE